MKPYFLKGKYVAMSYDPKCYDLAQAFVSDYEWGNEEAQTKCLAQAIQDAIEAWLEQFTLEAKQ